MVDDSEASSNRFVLVMGIATGIYLARQHPLSQLSSRFEQFRTGRSSDRLLVALGIVISNAHSDEVSEST